jgi:hypothetical protein
LIDRGGVWLPDWPVGHNPLLAKAFNSVSTLLSSQREEALCTAFGFVPYQKPPKMVPVAAEPAA